MAAVGFDLEEMDDLDTGRGEWINTPEVIRSTLKQLIISMQHERRERIKAQETVQRKVEELEGAGQGLKEALLTKASMTALRDMQASTATTEELNHMKSHNAHLNAQLERASAEVASLTARVASLAKHVDGNDEATSNAIKTHTARFQSDIDRVLRNVERVDTERSSEIQSLSARIADLHAALYRKADCSAVEQTAEAALSKDAFNTHMQSYMTRTALMQRLEPMDLGIASLQAGLAGVKDTMQSVQDAASAVTESGIDASIAAQATAIVEGAVQQLPSHSTIESVRHEIEQLRNSMAEGLEGRVSLGSLDRMREVLLTRDEFEATCYGLARRSELDAVKRMVGEPREDTDETQQGKAVIPPVHQRLDSVLAELRDVRQALATANIAVSSLQAEGSRTATHGRGAAVQAGLSHSEQLDLMARCKRALDGIEALNGSLHQVSARLDGMARRNEAIARSVSAAQGDANRALATAQECMASDVASSSDVHAVQEQLQSIRNRLAATEDVLEGGLLPKRKGGYATPTSAPLSTPSAAPASSRGGSALQGQPSSERHQSVHFSSSAYSAATMEQKQHKRPTLASFMAWGMPVRPDLTPANTLLHRASQSSPADSMRALRTAVGLAPSTPPMGAARGSSSQGAPHTAAPAVSHPPPASYAGGYRTTAIPGGSSASSAMNTPQQSRSANGSVFLSPGAWNSAATTPTAGGVNSSGVTAAPLRVGDVKHPFGTHSGAA